MEHCIGEINLPDITVFSSTVEDHLERLEAVISRLSQHNLKLKASKCEFLRSRIIYLGHVESVNGKRTDPEKTESIKTWSAPTSDKDVRVFQVFTGYYRKFLKDYAKIARLLNDLLIGHYTNNKGKKPKSKLKSQFISTEKQQLAFNTFKEKIISQQILAYADYKLLLKLHTDVSTTGLGNVLYQQQNGSERLVAYASRGLKPSEKNYPAHKLEFLALKWTVTEKLHDYLYGTNLMS